MNQKMNDIASGQWDKFQKSQGRWKFVLLWIAVPLWTIYTGTKVWDINVMTAPPGAWWIPLISVLVVSGGLIIWIQVLENLAKTDEQKEAAVAMIGVAWLFELMMAVADSMFNNQLTTLDIPVWVEWAVVVVPSLEVMIFTAGAAWFVYHDPDIQLKMKMMAAMNRVWEARNTAASDLADEHAASIGRQLAVAEFNGFLAQKTQRDDLMIKDHEDQPGPGKISQEELIKEATKVMAAGSNGHHPK